MIYWYIVVAVRRPHATTPGDDGLPMASGGTRQVPTTAMTGGMSSNMPPARPLMVGARNPDHMTRQTP